MATKDFTDTELVECIIDSLRKLLALGSNFNSESDLMAAGLDSLALTQLMLAIEDRTGIWVDESRITPENLRSVVTLAACVYEQMADP